MPLSLIELYETTDYKQSFTWQSMFDNWEVKNQFTRKQELRDASAEIYLKLRSWKDRWDGGKGNMFPVKMDTWSSSIDKGARTMPSFRCNSGDGIAQSKGTATWIRD